MSTEIEKAIQDKRTFQTIASGAVYKLPKYKVVPKVGLQKAQGSVLIPFVRGSKLEAEKEVLPVEGIVHESLLSMMIFDLELKNKEVPDDLTTEAIKLIEEARSLLETRTRQRAAKGTLSTYKK